MLTQAVVQRRQQEPAGIVAVAGLEEDQVDPAVIVPPFAESVSDMHHSLAYGLP